MDTNFATNNQRRFKMKVLFVVQGEGRGHLTQALALEKMLKENGHTVTEILVGRSDVRELPRFFINRAEAPFSSFLSPNFLPSKANKRIGLTRSIIYNIVKSPHYMASIHFIKEHIVNSDADLVINFYEILTGITYYLYHPQVPEVCIGHQYMFLHPEYKFPTVHNISRQLMIAFTKITCLGAKKKLALSFRNIIDDDAHDIAIVPPILRREALDTPRHHGDYVLGYMLNAGFSDSVIEWHKKHPGIELHFFWDKKDADETTRYDDTLTFHRIDDKKFLHYLANCKAYATTGGFESVCEAIYMGKPAMMVPAHVEQECNAHEAMMQGAGIVASEFNLDQLIQFCREYEEDIEFRMWENEAETKIISRLEAVVEQFRHEANSYPVGTSFATS